MLMREICAILLFAALLVSASASCENCRDCHPNPTDCSSCVNGVCLRGCVPGYHGRYCSERCPPGCADCHSEIQCFRCNEGRYGSVCQHECPHCVRGMCLMDTGECFQGCAPGYQGSPCQKIVPDNGAASNTAAAASGASGSDDPAKERKGLSAMFQEQDYLLPVIGCVLIVCGAIAVLIIYRQRRPKGKNSEEGYNVEEGKYDDVSPKSSFNKKSKLDDGDDSLESLRKRLSESDLPQLLTPHGEKLPLALLRNRTGNCSVPFMDPIVEDLEDDDDDDDKNAPYPHPKVVFHLAPLSDDDEEEEEDVPLMSSSAGGTDSCPKNGSSLSYSGSKAGSRDTSGSPACPIDKDDMYILQHGPNDYGHVAQSTDYMDSEASGQSTPMIPDMYMEHHHGEHSSFPRKLTDHLDTYLTSRPKSEVSSHQDGARTSRN